MAACFSRSHCDFEPAVFDVFLVFFVISPNIVSYQSDYALDIDLSSCEIPHNLDKDIGRASRVSGTPSADRRVSGQ